MIIYDDWSDVSSEPHEYVMPSSIAEALMNTHGNMYNEKDTFVGLIQDVYPPKHPRNRTGIQYEYLVAAIGKLQTHHPIHCVVRDKFGSNNDFEIFTLRKNQKVLVSCILGFNENGVIMGAVKNNSEPMTADLGHFWKRRFNNITNSIDKDSTYSIKNDSGTEVDVKNDMVILSDGSGGKVTVDRTSKTVTIEDGAGESIVLDRGSNTITVTGKTLNININGTASIKASGDCSVDAANIKLNGGLGPILSEVTYPFDPITGIPTTGIKTVRGG